MSKDATKISSVMAKIDKVTKKSGGDSKYLEEVTKKYKELQTIELPNTIGKNLSELEDMLVGLEEKLDALDIKTKDKKDNKFLLEQAKLMTQALHIKEAMSKQKDSYIDVQELADDRRAISEALEEVRQFIESETKKISKSVADAIAEHIGKGIEISLELPDENKFVADINDLISKVNSKLKDPLQVKYNLGYEATSAAATPTKNVENIKDAIKQEIAMIDKMLLAAQQDYAKYQAAFNENNKNANAKHGMTVSENQIKRNISK